MTRPAPAIDRAVSVLDYLADHPREGFTLSELSRRLELNKATCHAMFGAMEKYGLLLRDPVRKTYQLGPALIRLADSVAPDEHMALEYARGAMTRLSDELDLTCVVTGLIGEEMLVLARRLPTNAIANSAATGRRLRWAPPIGPTFAAWASPVVQDKWIARGDPDAAGGRAYYERMLRDIRRRGYDLGLESDPRSGLLRALEQLGGGHDTDELRHLVAGLLNDLPAVSGANGLGKPTAKHHVHNLTAPVFDRAGAVVIILTLDGFKGAIQTREIRRLADTLLEHVGRVTEAIHGRFPDDYPVPGQQPVS